MPAELHKAGHRQHYNARTDVLDVWLSDADETITEDTPSGFVVHYSVSSREPVAVTIWLYCRRFGGGARTLHVDAKEPFDLRIGRVADCEPEDVDQAGFDDALRQIVTFHPPKKRGRDKD
jgi:hypothetical protein